MAQKDYVARNPLSRKKQQDTRKKIKIMIALLLIAIAFTLALFFLKKNSSVTQKSKPVPVKTQPQVVLPSRPEETWSYIKQLETREVIVDDNLQTLEKRIQLTPEQKKILAQMEQDKAAELTTNNVSNKEQKIRDTTNTTQPVQTSASVTPTTEITSVKTESARKVEVTSGRQYGLQCGAFKNRAQAENLVVNLAKLGLSARVSASAEWNRVLVGPLGDRRLAVEAKEKSKKVTDCVVIGM